MKTQKLIVIAAIFCLLVGASGAAMAENTCEGGWITGTVDEDIILRGQSQGCTIDNATINGNVIATGGADVTIQVSNVNGRIRIVDATTAVIFGTTAQNVRIARNTVAVLLSNIVQENIVVNRNDIARVNKNLAVQSLSCRGNDDLKASGNSVGPFGSENCNLVGN